MLRTGLTVFRALRPSGARTSWSTLGRTIPSATPPALPLSQSRTFCGLISNSSPQIAPQRFQSGLISSPSFNQSLLLAASGLNQPVRTLTKFSRQSGKRKTVKAVIKRFKRLDWGIWIHTKSGRHKKLWKKTSARKRRLRQHVFSNGTQSWLLDKMVTKFWRRPKFYVNDPYTPYHTREEYYKTKRVS